MSIGKVINVTSAKGGTGVSNVATLLAYTFVEEANKHGEELNVVVVDGNFRGKSALTKFVFPYEEIPFEDTVGPLLEKENLDDITLNDIDEIVKYADLYNVFTLPGVIDAKVTVDDEKLHAVYERVISLLREDFDLVVVDGGATSANGTFFVENSDLSLLVSPLNIIDMKATQKLLSSLVGDDSVDENDESFELNDDVHNKGKLLPKDRVQMIFNKVGDFKGEMLKNLEVDVDDNVIGILDKDKLMTYYAEDPSRLPEPIMKKFADILENIGNILR